MPLITPLLNSGSAAHEEMKLDEKAEKAENEHLLNGNASSIDTHANGGCFAGTVCAHATPN